MDIEINYNNLSERLNIIKSFNLECYEFDYKSKITVSDDDLIMLKNFDYSEIINDKLTKRKDDNGWSGFATNNIGYRITYTPDDSNFNNMKYLYLFAELSMRDSLNFVQQNVYNFKIINKKDIKFLTNNNKSDLLIVNCFAEINPQINLKHYLLNNTITSDNLQCIVFQLIYALIKFKTLYILFSHGNYVTENVYLEDKPLKNKSLIIDDNLFNINCDYEVKIGGFDNSTTDTEHNYLDVQYILFDIYNILKSKTDVNNNVYSEFYEFVEHIIPEKYRVENLQNNVIESNIITNFNLNNLITKNLYFKKLFMSNDVELKGLKNKRIVHMNMNYNDLGEISDNEEFGKITTDYDNDLFDVDNNPSLDSDAVYDPKISHDDDVQQDDLDYDDTMFGNYNMDNKEQFELNPPIIVEFYEGNHVIQDTNLIGGTKQRGYSYIKQLKNDGYDEIVTFMNPYGVSQLCLAYLCNYFNMKCTIFIQKLSNKQKYTNDAINNYKANIIELINKKNNKQNVTKQQFINHIHHYSKDKTNKIKLFIDGFNDSEYITHLGKGIEKSLIGIDINPKTIIVASCTGVLPQILSIIFPKTKIIIVEVANNIEIPKDNKQFIKYKSNYKFSEPTKILPPYESMLNYDAKIWEIVKNNNLMDCHIWNVK